METVREKLRKVIKKIFVEEDIRLYCRKQDEKNEEGIELCCDCLYCEKSCCMETLLTDRLIQNGVTIQEWVSVDEPPKEDGKYIVCTAKNTVYCAKYYANGKHFGTEMNTHITHWMPLPEPPKGVQ